jgi:hypothetical protein
MKMLLESQTLRRADPWRGEAMDGAPAACELRARDAVSLFSRHTAQSVIEGAPCPVLVVRERNGI